MTCCWCRCSQPASHHGDQHRHDYEGSSGWNPWWYSVPQYTPESNNFNKLETAGNFNHTESGKALSVLLRDCFACTT
jgi:hypothetical protein